MIAELSETQVARGAESAIGRRPLTAVERRALFAAWQHVHGHGFDCAAHLRALEAEVAGKKAKAAMVERQRQDEATAERRLDERRGKAVRDAAVEAAELLRRNLTEVLAKRLPEVFGETAWSSDRQPVPVVVGPGDRAPGGAGNLIAVTAEAIGGPVDRPEANVLVEVRGASKELVSAILRVGHDGSAITDALAGATCFRHARQSGVIGVDDTRRLVSAPDATGSYGNAPALVGGAFSATVRLSLLLAANPAADPDAPAKPPAETPKASAAWCSGGRWRETPG